MNFDFWRLRFNEWKLMRTKKQHSDSAKKLKIWTEKLCFTTDDESCWEEFQCTKTLKCFAFLTQLFKFESSIISSEKSFSFFFELAFFLEHWTFHSKTTSKKGFMRSQRISEMNSTSLTTKRYFRFHQSFSHYKQQVWIQH